VDEVSGILKGTVWLAVAGNVANHSLLAAGEIALELALNQLVSDCQTKTLLSLLPK
jgi:hypothetical protein